MNVRLLLPVLLVSALAGGCSIFEPAPSEDPVLIKLNELESRLDSIERIIDNQSLPQLTQQVSELERRAASGGDLARERVRGGLRSRHG